MHILHSKSKSSSRFFAGKKGKAKPVIIDLDRSKDGSSGGEDTSLMQAQLEWVAKLNKELSKCQLCGPNVLCKISYTGNHIKMSHHQTRAWADALVCSDHLIIIFI